MKHITEKLYKEMHSRIITALDENRIADHSQLNETFDFEDDCVELTVSTWASYDMEGDNFTSELQIWFKHIGCRFEVSCRAYSEDCEDIGSDFDAERLFEMF